MKKIIKLIIILATGLGALYSATLAFPVASAAVILWAYATSADLSHKQIETPQGVIHYLEGGQGDAVLLLHGVFARKEHWINMARHLTDDYHVIALDIPGFGENAPLMGEEYAYADQAGRVKDAIESLQLTKFHIAANSMGGQIGAQIAHDWPDRVLSIAFIGSPAGIMTPEQTDFQIQNAAGLVDLVVSNRAEYGARNEILFTKKPFVPKVLEDVWFSGELANAALYRQVWNVIQTTNITPLQSLAPDLKMPSLIIWCQQDKNYHVSGAAVLAQLLQNSTLITPQGCGHLPMLERPNKTGRDLLTFLKEI